MHADVYRPEGCRTSRTIHAALRTLHDTVAREQIGVSDSLRILTTK